MLEIRIDDIGASSKVFNQRGQKHFFYRGKRVFYFPFANWGFLKRVRPFRGWAPYSELTVEEWQAMMPIFETTGIKPIVAVTACWVEKNGDLTPFPQKFPEVAAFLKQAFHEGKITIANHGLTHCIVGKHLPKLFHSNQKYHREFYADLPNEWHVEHVTRAEKILEDFFERPITVFVPPGNIWGKKTYDALLKTHIKEVRCSRDMQDAVTPATGPIAFLQDAPGRLAIHDRDIKGAAGRAWLQKKIGEYNQKKTEIVYVANSRIENTGSANQVQTRNTFAALTAQNPNVLGIFLGNKPALWQRVRWESGNAYIDISAPLTRLLSLIEAVTKTTIARRNILGWLFARAAAHVVKDCTNAKALYTRQGNCNEFLVWCKAAKRLPVKRMVFELHDLEHDIAGFYQYQWEKKRAATIFSSIVEKIMAQPKKLQLATLTKTLAARVRQEYQYTEAIEIVADAHNFEVVEPRPAHQRPTTEIIYTGLSFAVTKGIPTLIESLRFLPESMRLRIIGGNEKSRSDLKEKYNDLVKIGQLTVEDSVPHDQVKALLQSADIAVVPLPAGGFSDFTSPLKLFEYMSVGLPIVASNIPALREIITDKENALLFEPGNSKDLAEKIKRLAGDKAMAVRLGTRAFMDAKQYTYTERAKKILRILTE